MVEHTAVAVGVEVTYAPDREWTDKWREMMRCIGELSDAYAGPRDWAKDNTDYRKLIHDLCDACLEVRDALVRNGIPRREVYDYVNRAASALALVADVSNTDKHSGRDQSRRRAAVRSVNMQPNEGISVLIATYDGNGNVVETRDSLDMATAALAEWRAFLASHELDEPAETDRC